MLNRRDVLRALGAGGTVGWLAGRPGVAAAEPPPGPQKILAQGTDWRFLHELSKELKR